MNEFYLSGLPVEVDLLDDVTGEYWDGELQTICGVGSAPSGLVAVDGTWFTASNDESFGSVLAAADERA